MFPLPPLPLLPLQLNVPLPTLSVGTMFNAVPEQIMFTPAATLLPTGTGSTVTVRVVAVPAHPFALGVIIY